LGEAVGHATKAATDLEDSLRLAHGRGCTAKIEEGVGLPGTLGKKLVVLVEVSRRYVPGTVSPSGPVPKFPRLCYSPVHD
jgi:hypothetical protein